ncbi:MAG TPA: hypothetical protein VH760_03200 [Gaiellaceae bacterium]|jgi:hypothetical protein
MSFETTERRKTMTRTYDVSSTFVHTIDADHGTAQEVLAGIDPMHSLADRLSALGLDDRAIWSTDGELGYTLIWRFGPDQGHARLDWRLALQPIGAGRTTLTVRLAARGSDAEARIRVLRSWLLFDAVAESHAAGLARMVDDYAEDAPQPVEAPRLLAVGLGL